VPECVVNFAYIEAKSAALLAVKRGFSTRIDTKVAAEAGGGAMLLLFDNNAGTGELFAQPLSVITDDRNIRLLY